MAGGWGGAGHSKEGVLLTADGQGVPCGCGSEGPGALRGKGRRSQCPGGHIDRGVAHWGRKGTHSVRPEASDWQGKGPLPSG